MEVLKPQSIDETLKERAARYGKFTEHARISQELKKVMFSGKWAALDADQKESLELIAHKIARILCAGDPNYKDSWHDIAGYAKLIDDRL
jgi:hypothetical protein